MLAVYKKEMTSYFTSMVGYMFIAFFLFIVGLYSYWYNLEGGYANISYALYNVTFFFIFLVPMVTMRIMAEENKSKTDQMLFTSPVSVTKIMLGKYFAVVTLIAIALLIVCVYPLFLKPYGDVNLKIAFSAIGALFLLACAYFAIGFFISSVTDSQAFAAVITFIVILATIMSNSFSSSLPTDNRSAWLIFSGLYLLFVIVAYLMMHNITVCIAIGWVGEMVLAILYFMRPETFDGSVVAFCDWFSVMGRYDNFVIGGVELSTVVYYISISFLFVFMAIQAIKKRRWN